MKVNLAGIHRQIFVGILAWLFMGPMGLTLAQQYQNSSEAASLQQALSRIDTLEFQLGQMQQALGGTAAAVPAGEHPSFVNGGSCDCQPCCGKC